MDIDASNLSILDCAPPGIKLRGVQKEFLLWFEENYDKNDVLVCRMPVGSGKSYVAITVSNWMKRKHNKTSAIITPLKLLQDQYAKDFPYIPLLKGASNYTCGIGDNLNCKQSKSILGRYCPGCPYTSAVKTAKESDACIMNFHSYYHNEAYKDVLICDEGHNTANFIYSLFGAKLWIPEMKCGDIDENPESVIEAINNYIGILDENRRVANMTNNAALVEKIEEEISSKQMLVHVLKNYPNDTILKKKTDKYFGALKELKGSEQKFIYIKPLKIHKICQNILWPEEVKKIVFLSATIGEKDIEKLGLDNRRVAYFECDSPIPAENRPFYVWPVANMSYKNRKESIPVIVEAIKRILAKFPNDKGIIHCTYDTAKAFRELLDDRRILFHNELNKTDVYNQFRASKTPSVLIASGMAEGIDLPDDAARWQVITQVMYPNLQDDVNMWYCKNDHSSYQWEAVRMIEQQTGRICRHPEDKGTTIILDQQFADLFNKTHHGRKNNGKPSMWSKGFVEAMK